MQAVVKLVRSKVPPLSGDRFMAPDIEAVSALVKSGELAHVALGAES